MKAGAALLAGFLICLMMLLPSGAFAATASAVISQVQTGGDSASAEMIELTNSSDGDIDITDWCVHYASAASTEPGRALYCFSIDGLHDRLVLSAGGSVLLATDAFMLEQPGYIVGEMMSGGLSSSGGHVHLVDGSGLVVDSLGWGSAVNAETEPTSVPADTETLQRRIKEGRYQDTDNNAADFIIGALAEPANYGLYEAVDMCLNQTDFPGLQTAVPGGFEVDESGECYEADQKTDCGQLRLSEILPNPAGADSGFEYVELFNVGDEVVNLEDCDFSVNGQDYVLDGVVNAGDFFLVHGINLPNASGGVVTVASESSEDSATYPANMKDDEAWALVDGSWQITDRSTPGAANKSATPSAVIASSSDNDLGPCPVGKFRNPLTNRCKLIDSGTDLKPCAEDQFRNPETNRCKKIESGSTLKPCSPGQERNPATNRCKSTASAESLLKPCDEGEERNPETNRCRRVTGVAGVASAVDSETGQRVSQNYRVVGGALLVAVLYGVFEYRQDIANKLGFLRRK